MTLQFIHDNKGKTTGVFIPIEEWNALKSKYSDIEDEVMSIIPEWQKDIVNQRLKDYKHNNVQALDFEIAMDEIEKEL
ncbi:MAG TPA: addiction module protein [Chitinophagales bacterium]|nr:addiction module protein [Chitinophagales bacterium]